MLCVVRVDTYEDALALLRDSPFGNGVALFTRDGGAARRFADEVEADIASAGAAVRIWFGLR